MHRFIEEEACRQENMETITGKAIPLLTEESHADAIEDDWVTNFFEKSRIVSDDEMQALWARVLAGEAKSPGTFTKRTVNFLGDLDKSDAELFAKLCGFGVQIGDLVPLIFDVQDHLESIGLIQFNHITGFRRLNLPKRFAVLYYGQPIQLFLSKTDGENDLKTGKVLLTQVGQELAPICGSTPVEDFLEYVRMKWKDNLADESTKQTDIVLQWGTD